MSQSWLIFAGLLICASAPSALSVYGSCASIGYSTKCCPSSEEHNCQATNGDCFCNPLCHFYGDCCEDVHCPAQPSTCADVGITQCCNDPNGTGHCGVHFQDNSYRCSCNVSCHERDDCCPDAREFCMQPRTCEDVGITQCCSDPSGTGHCDVRFKDSDNILCSCNASCHERNDCCPDAREFCMRSRSTNRFSRMRMQSFQTDRVLSRRRPNNREQRVYRQRSNIKYVYQETPAGRVEQQFLND